MEALGKKRCAKMGLQFTSSFQRLHQNVVPKNHWRNFCIYLALGMTPHPQCGMCQKVMSQASMTIEEAELEVPGGPEFVKQMRLTKPAAAGIVRGRPKKGQATFNLWQWLESDRKGQYEHLPAEAGKPAALKCLACKAEISLIRESTNFFVVQHEQSKKHKTSISHADGSLQVCAGIDVKKFNAEIEELRGWDPAFEVWAAAGFPWNNNSVAPAPSPSKTARHACHRGEDTHVVIQADICDREQHNRQPEKAWCCHCERLATSKSFLQKVSRWAYRIYLVQLVHATFADNEKLRAKILELFKTYVFLSQEATGWDDVEPDLSTLSYGQLFETCRLKVGCLPRSICNKEAWAFIESQFSWLSSKKPVIEDAAHATMLSKYSQALCKGALPSEMQIAQHVLSGKLRSDTVLRTLVTALVSKCSNKENARRKCSNNLVGIDQTDLAETGFALACCASAISETVQR